MGTTIIVQQLVSVLLHAVLHYARLECREAGRIISCYKAVQLWPGSLFSWTLCISVMCNPSDEERAGLCNGFKPTCNHQRIEFTCHEGFPHYKAEQFKLLCYLLYFSVMAYWTPGQVAACCLTSRVLLWLSSYPRVHTTLICEPATLLIPSLSARHVTFTVNLYASGFGTISFQNIRCMVICSGCL